MKKKEIEVVSYNDDWPKMFDLEALKIKEILGSHCLAIHHVGSTSIPGLVAKPTIDIIPVVKDPQVIIGLLESLGYEYKGEYNIPLHYGFSKRTETISVNLHVYEDGHPEIELNLLFRDYLRKHPDKRDEYADLKKNLLKDESSFIKNNASLFTGYTLGKGAFIHAILKQAGLKSLRLLRCTHYAEWDAANFFRKAYFADETPAISFTAPNHVHFILYQGVDIIGYAHLELCFRTLEKIGTNMAKIKMIVIDEPQRKKGYGGQFRALMEKWLKAQHYKLHQGSGVWPYLFFNSLISASVHQVLTQ